MLASQDMGRTWKPSPDRRLAVALTEQQKKAIFVHAYVRAKEGKPPLFKKKVPTPPSTLPGEKAKLIRP